MSRQENDNRGRLGGRQKGTPNKDKPLKATLREHSLAYFSTPAVDEYDADGNPTGRRITQFQADQAMLEPAQRVDTELKLLRFHTPQMQSTAIDVAQSQATRSLAEHIKALAAGETTFHRCGE